MRILDTLLAVGRGTHMCRAVFWFLNDCLSHRRVRMDLEAAEELMAARHADGGRSCLTVNRVEPQPKYDLLVVVPAYNAGKYVEDCVISLIRQQTDYAFRVAVVDDGSTDGTAAILRRFGAEERITVVRQENRGVSAARNKALQHIDARYVMFVDADDTLPPDAVESLLEKAYECNSDIVEGCISRMDGGVAVIHTDCDEADDISGFPFGKLIKASLLERVGFPEGYRYEDTIMSLILCPLARRMSTVENTVYMYRMHEGNFTSNERHNYASLDAYWVVRRLLRDAETLGIPFDARLYTSVLHGMKLSGQRMNSLDTDTSRAYFAAMCCLVSRYFPDVSPVSRTDRGGKALMELDKAVRRNDYTKYMLASYFL